MLDEVIKRFVLLVFVFVIGFLVVFEVGLICKYVIDICSNEYMICEQKVKSVFREIVILIYGIIGLVFGQVLIFVLVVGSLVGGVVGNIFGSVIYEVIYFIVDYN